MDNNSNKLDNKSSKSQSTSNFNISCYCKSQLTKYKNSRDGRICINCAKPISDDDQYLYPCFNAECIYLRLGTQDYLICSSCYNLSNNDKIKQSPTTDFILDKFCNSINVISLVISFIFTQIHKINQQKTTQNKANEMKKIKDKTDDKKRYLDNIYWQLNTEWIKNCMLLLYNIYIGHKMSV